MRNFCTFSLAVLLLTSCGNDTDKFIGKHIVNIPMRAKTEDTTKRVQVGTYFRRIGFPTVYYIDYYPSILNIYRTEDNNNLSGQLTLVYPKTYQPGLDMKFIKLTDFRIEDDTLYFTVDVNTTFKFELIMNNFITESDGKIIIGISKKLLNGGIWMNSCTKNIVNETEDFYCFEAGQSVNKKEFYQCQIDSLQKVLNHNSRENDNAQNNIDFIKSLIRKH